MKGGCHVSPKGIDAVSLLFSIVSSVPSRRLMHNEYLINKRKKMELSKIYNYLSN